MIKEEREAKQCLRSTCHVVNTQAILEFLCSFPQLGLCAIAPGSANLTRSVDLFFQVSPLPLHCHSLSLRLTVIICPAATTSVITLYSWLYITSIVQSIKPLYSPLNPSLCLSSVHSVLSLCESRHKQGLKGDKAVFVAKPWCSYFMGDI